MERAGKLGTMIASLKMFGDKQNKRRGSKNMIEREVKVFDSNINIHPIDAKKIDKIISSPQFESVELTSRTEEVNAVDQTIYIRQRKIKRQKSAGIF
jgi:hypothetical protein